MKTVPYDRRGKNSPLYYHMQQCFELRNQCHTHWLWLHGDCQILPSEKREMLGHLALAKQVLSDALEYAQKEYRKERDLFGTLTKKGGRV